MTLQERLKRLLRDRDERVADLARHLGRPYTTVREWVIHGRDPMLPERDRVQLERKLTVLEGKS